MLLSTIAVLLPIFFVLGLGYFAGRTKQFDADQVKGINDLVLDYAMPALMFVATVSTTRAQILSETRFALGLLIAFVGMFLAVFIVSTRVLHHNIGEAALQANLVSFPSVGFMGPPIFQGLFGEASIVSIATAAVISGITIVPLTLVLLEIHRARSAGGEAREVSTLVVQALVSTLKKPMVLAPIIGTLIVLVEIPVPQVLNTMLKLIGGTTGGVSIFLAGLIIAAYPVKFDVEILGNVFAKMIVQPLLMVALVLALAISNPLASEGILICAIPSAVFAPLLAPRYRIYEVESSSTLVLTALAMIVTLPLTILLTGGT